MKAAKRFTAPPPIPAGNFLPRYNAAMSKPFQFSMLRMFITDSHACIGGFPYAIALRRGTDERVALAIECLSGAVAGRRAGQFFAGLS
jgi:hypothetical protein